MAKFGSITGRVSVTILAMAWPTAALAQDMTWVVVVAAPAALAAPVAALFMKMKIASLLSRRRLLAAAFAELLLWALVLPAGSLVELRMLGLDWQHSAIATLAICAAGALALNAWVLASGTGKRRLALALLFALLTPLAFLFIGGATWALLAVTG